MLILDQLKEMSGQSVVLDSLGDLSPGREPLFNVGNLTGKSYHEITHFKRMGLNDLSSNSLILTRE